MQKKNQNIKHSIERKLYKLLEMIHLGNEGAYNEIVEDIQCELDNLDNNSSTEDEA